jgi:hypothetical protein
MKSRRYKWQLRWTLDRDAGTATHDSGLVLRMPDADPSNLADIMPSIAQQHGGHNAPLMVRRMQFEARQLWTAPKMGRPIGSKQPDSVDPDPDPEPARRLFPLLEEPHPADVLAARTKAGQNQLEAAQAVGFARRWTWADYEADRRMQPAVWTWYLLATDQHPDARLTRRRK